MSDDPPNPGSDDAIEQGCTCPVVDNSYGRGFYGDSSMFIYAKDCPLHGMEDDDA